MACGCSTGARLGLLLALATAACRKSESDVDLSPRLDGPVMPTGMGEDAGAPLDAAPGVPSPDVGNARASDLAAVAGDAAALIGRFKPPSGDFGSVAVGQQSAPQTFTFTNEEERPAGPLAATLGGPNATSFVLDEDRCDAVTLPPAGSCAVTLRFEPLEAGELAASLTLTVAGGGTATLVMGGTGLSP